MFDLIQGDDGGPMVVRGSNDHFEAVGAVSWGMGCGSGAPGVYVRLSRFIRWVETKMQLHGDY